MTRPFRFLVLLLATLAASAALPGCARADALVDVQVVDLDRGEVLPRWPHRGRDYVEGRPGHRYAVALQNLTGGRVLAVVSVDGVNAISGETAGAQQGGYVLDPWQRIEVRGWRKNLNEVAEFHFTSLGDSYAARTGRPGNVGVIGVAAFRERVPPPVYYPPPPPYSGTPYRGAAEPYASAERQASAPAAGAAADAAAPSVQAESAQSRAPGLARQQLGTGHGQRRWDAASVTTFERATTRPAQVATVWYDAWEALAARGIVPRHGYPHATTPEPFPMGFVPDP